MRGTIMRLVCQGKELNFSPTLVDFLSRNIALKPLKSVVKTDAQLKGKTSLKQRDVQELEKKTNSSIQLLVAQEQNKIF